MRRISVLFAAFALLLTCVVGYTYKLRVEKTKQAKVQAPPQIQPKYEALANSGWSYGKDDPQTNKPVVRATADSFEAAQDPSVFGLRHVALKLYDKAARQYTYVRSESASFDERSGLMKSEGAVQIIINVPADKDAANPKDAANLLQVQTSGISYETKSGTADTDQAAVFHFAQGGGSAVGVHYDPNTRDLILKSQVALDWVGKGPAQNKMHIEAGHVEYKELEHKVYLSPWSKLVRQGTTIQGLDSVVTLDSDGYLQRVDCRRANGVDSRDDKQTAFSADQMTTLFDSDDNITSIEGLGNARVVSTEAASRTTVTGNRALLQFAVVAKKDAPPDTAESDLSTVLATGHAVAQSDPLPQPGVPIAETRILRSDTINMQMAQGGRDVQEIHTPGPAQLEFKPNRDDQPHRFVDASRLQVIYGQGSYIETFVAWNAKTRTDNAKAAGKKGDAAAPLLTWSDEMRARFQPASNQVANIQQNGHFRYEEGKRKGSADTALLEQQINRITLNGNARLSDDTGSASADKIVMNQATGDMDAIGHVLSTHAPDPKQKPGTSMLDNTKTMQARADQMETRDDNTEVFYQGHAVVWQGANRISANFVEINRDDQVLRASGDVVSQLVDNKDNGSSSATAAPVYTVVTAPSLDYRDDKRVANYSGGVKLTHDRLTVTSHNLQAFLTPKSNDNKSDDSSLDHAYADGDVHVSETLVSGVSRVGTSEHCEYYTATSKVVLNGGHPQMVDSHKGITKGKELTYYSNDDRMIVEGENKQLAYTQMKKN